MVKKVQIVSVERLQHGLARAKAKSKSRTQSGAIKVQGSKTTLEQVKPSRATAQALAPAPPGECCPRSSTRPEWQCDGPWSEVAQWDGNSKQDPSMPYGRPMALGGRG